MIVADGEQLAEKWLKTLRAQVGDLPTGQAGRLLHLAAVLIGADEGLKKFVKLKKQAAEQIGIQFSVYEFGPENEQKEILETIAWLGNDPTVHGILVELPVPKPFDAQTILNAIPEAKDVDVLSESMQEKYYTGRSPILPPAVLALQVLFKEYPTNPKYKKAAVFGQGMLVGKPISYWLKEQGAEVFMIDEHTPDPRQYSLQADIVVSGVGKPGLITEDMLKDDAVVVDYGYGREGGKMVGDVDLQSAAQKVSLVTPVPGGMGPLVVVAVLENLIKLAP